MAGLFGPHPILTPSCKRRLAKSVTCRVLPRKAGASGWRDRWPSMTPALPRIAQDALTARAIADIGQTRAVAAGLAGGTSPVAASSAAP